MFLYDPPGGAALGVSFVFASLLALAAALFVWTPPDGAAALFVYTPPGGALANT